MKSLLALLSLTILASLQPQTSHAATDIEIVAFNVKWFGSNVNDPRGNHPTPIDPKLVQRRTDVMKDFFAKVVQPKGVVVFSEFVDQNLLKAILPANWTCAGYQHLNPYHQHVVICAAPQFKILTVPYDNNTVIETVLGEDKDWSRPGVRIDIANQQGQRLLRVVGLHLKSAPNFSSERVRQMQMVAQDLRNQPGVPTIILGDMNTFPIADTHQSQPDALLLQGALQQIDPSFKLLAHKEAYTFRSPRNKAQFDQIYYNGAVQPLAPPSVFAVCNEKQNGSGYLDINYYYNNVSDHCPVKTVVRLQQGRRLR